MDKENSSTKLEANNKSISALREEAILEFWKEREIFKKSLEKDSPKGEYVFYEGPPTANGKPGIHHLEARAFKDVIPRYKTMQGYHVRRKGGWDTHGLPVELQVEKALGLDSKKAIEEYGIAEFNQKCKESVWDYLEFWNLFTRRIGYWVDQKNPYVTYHNEYIESVWNVIKTANDKNLLYKDYKVVPWCPRCGTALSSHELAQGYENVKDLSVYVKFKVKVQENTYILAWTTTPWTLPGNVALAVGEKIDYVKIIITSETGVNISKGGQILNSFMGQIFYVAKQRLESIHTALDGRILGYKILQEFKGEDLIGLEYEPLYPFIKNNITDEEKKKMDKAYKVYSADFVTTEDGTGVVHTAVMYGQDDFVLGNEIGLPKYHLVGLDGKFLSGTEFLEGKFVRDENTAVEIIKDLASRNLLMKKEKYEHSYPHCWRCHTALIYYARDSWYIRMSSLKDEMIKENKEINWEPGYIKEGRFGEWLREIKDWAISRERYWGTPLPVWVCKDCNKIEVLGSLEEIKQKTKKSGNKYFVMRHGGAESNLTGKISSKVIDVDNLTEEGILQVKKTAESLKDKNIDLIISSDFLRTKNTAEITKDILKLNNEIIFDERLREIYAGKYDGGFWNDYPRFFDKAKEGEGESLLEVKRRVLEFLYDIDKKYENKNILIVSHEAPIRLLFSFDFLDFNLENNEEYKKQILPFDNAEVRQLDFVKVPHNKDYELDLHKPYIDEVELICTHSIVSTSSLEANLRQTCGGRLERAKEVMDVWLDSGTMPFSQDHYPFKNKDLIDNGSGYPADFISEAIDQTRGWFYTLHAVGTIMGKGKAFKNVICLGHLLDAKGKKMSKSLGNVVEPFQMMDKYGVDTLRMWMYAVNQPGESKNFDEKTVSELHNKVFNLLYNVLSFYELYRDIDLEKIEYKYSKNILDQWIVARLGELINNVTTNLDNYKLLEPVRAIRDFIDDLSTWYLRRSRERIKSGDKEAKQTLYFVLKNLAKLMSPFAPFSAEDIWQKLKISLALKDDARDDFAKSDAESVHLENWPDVSTWELSSQVGAELPSELPSGSVLEKMDKTREIVTLALQKRQKAGIPVRQPLSSLSIKIVGEKLEEEYLELIKDEINVKNIVFDNNIEEEISLNLNIDEELKSEGKIRELMRAIQDMRKKEKLNPNDLIIFEIETTKEGEDLINKFKEEFIKIIGAKEILMKENQGMAKLSIAESPDVSKETFKEIIIDNLIFKVNLLK